MDYELKLGDWRQYALQYAREGMERIERERAELQTQFPHVVTFEGLYEDHDRAQLYCWEHFGPRHGDCCGEVCLLPPDRAEPPQPAKHVRSHSHEGVWTSYWIERSAYNYGFFDMYFSTEDQKARFLAGFMESDAR